LVVGGLLVEPAVVYGNLFFSIPFGWVVKVGSFCPDVNRSQPAGNQAVLSKLWRWHLGLIRYRIPFGASVVDRGRPRRRSNLNLQSQFDDWSLAESHMYLTVLGVLASVAVERAKESRDFELVSR